MSQTLTITSVDANKPVEIYYCDITGQDCVYVARVYSFPYTFEVLDPYDYSDYLIKIIDADGCVIIDTINITPTPTVTTGLTPTATPSNTKTPTVTPSISLSASVTPTPTKTPVPSTTPSRTPISTLLPNDCFPVTPSTTPIEASPLPTPSITPTIARYPDADFIVFQYTLASGAGTDLDTLTTLDYPTTIGPLGYCTTGNLATPGVYGGPYLYWGGDNMTASGNEADYVDIKALKLSYPALTGVTLTCKANWFSSRGNGDVYITMYAYSGGTMISNGAWGFSNIGGVLLGVRTFPTINITTVNSTCSAIDCVGTYTYQISNGQFIKNICVDPTPTPTPTQTPSAPTPTPTSTTITPTPTATQTSTSVTPTPSPTQGSIGITSIFIYIPNL